MGAGASCCGRQKLEEGSKYAETDNKPYTNVEDSTKILCHVTEPIEEAKKAPVQEEEPDIIKPAIADESSQPSILDFKTKMSDQENKEGREIEDNIQHEIYLENSVLREKDAGDISIGHNSDLKTVSDTDEVKTGMTGDCRTSGAKHVKEHERTEDKRRRRVKDKDKRTVDKMISGPKTDPAEPVGKLSKKISSETSETVDIKESQSSSDSSEDLPIDVDLDSVTNEVLSDKYVRHVAERMLAARPVQDELDMVPLNEKSSHERVNGSSNTQNEEIISGTDPESETSESESGSVVERRFDNSIDDWDCISELASEKMQEVEKPVHELDVTSVNHGETIKRHGCSCSNGGIRASHRLSRNMNHKSDSNGSSSGIPIEPHNKESQGSCVLHDSSSALTKTSAQQVPSEEHSKEISNSCCSHQKPDRLQSSGTSSDVYNQAGSRRWMRKFKPLIYNPSDTVQPHRRIGNVPSWHMVDGYYIPGSPTVLSVRTEASCSPEAARERRAIEHQEGIWCWGGSPDKSNVHADDVAEHNCGAATNHDHKDCHKEKSSHANVTNPPGTVYQRVPSKRSVLQDSDDWVLSERRLQLWMENSRLHSRRSGNTCSPERHNGATNSSLEHQSSNNREA